MIHISIVEKDADKSLSIVNHCKEIIKDYFIQIKVFESFDALILDEEFLHKTELLIANVLDENHVNAVKSLKALHASMSTIFYSNQLQLATLLYEVNPTYFIYDKQLFSILERALLRCLEAIQDQSQKKLAIKYNSKINIIPIEEIVLIERLNRRLRICTIHDEYSCYTSFDDMIDLLKEFCFIRTHTSYLVHPDYIEQYDNDHIILKNGEYIPISRKYKKAVKNILMNNVIYPDSLLSFAQ